MTNLAVGKPATQSSTSPFSTGSTPEDDASGGNNGDLATPWGFHTAVEADPWWQVDLGRDAIIREIVIHNRQDQADRLTRFSVLGSRDGVIWRAFYRKSDHIEFGRGGAPYFAIAPANVVARFVRLQADGVTCLHTREIEVHGDWAGDIVATLPEAGTLYQVGDFSVRVDEARYSPTMVAALGNGHYESRERQAVRAALELGDRVLEVGTAVGVVSMAAAAIVGTQAVMTFDANPDIVRDARANFARNGLSAINGRHGLLKNRTTIQTGGRDAVPFFIHRDFWASRMNAEPADPGIERIVDVPVYCLEDEIAAHRATVLICDIEGGEVALLGDADLAPIRKIIMETHYWSAGRAETDALIRRLVTDGFDIDLDHVAEHLLILRRNQAPLSDAEKVAVTRQIASASRPAHDVL